MPKSQYVDPAKAFDAGYIHFEDIPVCQYNKTIEEELTLYTKDAESGGVLQSDKGIYLQMPWREVDNADVLILQ